MTDHTPTGAPDTMALDIPFAPAHPDLTTGLPPIFRRAVDRAYTRFDVSAPRILGVHIVATDGRILVRMPAAGVDPDVLQRLTARTGRAGRFPTNVGDLITDYGPYARAGIPVPDCPPDPGPCPHCKGKGNIAASDLCRACGGSGAISILGDFDDCPDCDGELVKPGPCDPCNGTGLATEDEPEDSDRRGSISIEVAPGVHLAVHYLRHLAGGTLYPSLRPGSAVRFTVGTVEGVLMPLKT